MYCSRRRDLPAIETSGRPLLKSLAHSPEMPESAAQAREHREARMSTIARLSTFDV